MITVRKANKIVRVIENELDKYLSKGYVIEGASTVEQKPIKTEPIKKETPIVEVTPQPKVVEQPKSRRRKK